MIAPRIQQSSDSKTLRWSRGGASERYIGRWSHRVAGPFVRWLDAPAGCSWLDVGCGTGALSRAILAADRSETLIVCGVDPSRAFVDVARADTADHGARFTVGSAEELQFPPGTFDTVVCGLVLNFLADPVSAVREMARVCRPGGSVAGYVWDYTGEMWLLRYFWETVFALVWTNPELLRHLG